jgi:hypothetical protein
MATVSPDTRVQQAHLRTITIGPGEAGTPTMEKVVSNTFKYNGWPNWTSSICKETSHTLAQRLDFTIRMDPKTRAYAPSSEPQETFKKAMTFFENIQGKIKESGHTGIQIVSETITKQMANVIFGSNAIERAGLGLEETMRICEKIFRGETVDPEDIPERYFFPVSCSLLPLIISPQTSC